MLEQEVHELKIAATELIQAMEWEESAHERDKSGKFSGSGGSKAKPKAEIREFGELVDGLDAGAKSLNDTFNKLGKAIGKKMPPSKTPVKDFVKGVKDLGKTTAKNIDDAAHLNAARVAAVAALATTKKDRDTFTKELSSAKNLNEALGTIRGMAKIVNIGALARVASPSVEQTAAAVTAALDISIGVTIGQVAYAAIKKHRGSPSKHKTGAPSEAIDFKSTRVD
jgi:hypothetical protein